MNVFDIILSKTDHMFNCNLCKTPKITDSSLNFIPSKKAIKKYSEDFKEKVCFSRMFSFTAKTVCVQNREGWPCGNGKGNQTKTMEKNFFFVAKM